MLQRLCLELDQYTLTFNWITKPSSNAKLGSIPMYTNVNTILLRFVTHSDTSLVHAFSKGLSTFVS